MIKQKVLNCTNLIGDSLYLLGPVKKYLELHCDEVAAIQVDRKLAGELFTRTFGSNLVPFTYSDEETERIFPDSEVLHLGAGRASDLANQYLHKYHRQPYISEGYAMLLGIDIEGKLTPPPDWQSYIGQDIEKEYSLIFPFSKSCSRWGPEKRANKTLDDWKWEYIIHFLRRHGYGPVKVESAPGERLQDVSILETDYLETMGLKNLELSLRKAKLCISVDTGLAHLASAVGTKTIVLWPAASCIEFIAPCWSPTTAILQMGDPNKIIPAQLLVGVRKLLVWLEDGRR